MREASAEARGAAARSIGARDDIAAATQSMRETLADQQRQLDELRTMAEALPSPIPKVEPEEGEPV